MVVLYMVSELISRCHIYLCSAVLGLVYFVTVGTVTVSNLSSRHLDVHYCEISVVAVDS